MSGPQPEILAGPLPGAGWEANLESVRTAPRLPPFDADAVGFVAALAAAILRDRAMRDLPEAMALAHGLRPVRLRALAETFRARAAERIRRARGLVFHVAPANVDTVFAWSWLLSLLAGNANVVRLSRRGGAAQAAVLETARRLFEAEAWQEMRRRTLILAYDRDPEINERLSLACDLRVVWGGDATVRAFRAVPLPPLAQELSFPDRTSAAVLNAGTVAGADGTVLRRLAEGLVNDVLWHDQNACASPRSVVWVGTPEAVAVARQRFWSAIDARVAEMGWALDGAGTVARLVAACREAAAGTVVRWTGPTDGHHVLRGTVVGGRTTLSGDHPGLGTLVEHAAEDPDAAMQALPADVQTVVTAGINAAALLSAADRQGRRIDRVGAVGHALDFQPDWDGQDLLERFTRVIAVE